jgi:DNA (cytosine-5)-methyltransferase 1
MTVKWQSEIDPYCTQVLAKHWPDVPNLGDIKQINWDEVEPVDVIAGGYPCQPFSTAGLRKGTDDERHLWPYFFDAIRILRPRYALLENVAGHLTLGFADVLADLASVGYDVEWDCIPAAAVGAPHRRDRLWAVAYPASKSSNERGHGKSAQTSDSRFATRIGYRNETVADTASVTKREPTDKTNTVTARRDAWPKPRRRSWWQVEPAVGRVANGVSDGLVGLNGDKLTALGNAVVPQVAEHVAQIIIEKENAA